VSNVELLSFPPPYRAALALSNDTDDLWEPGSWWEFLRWLNTTESTRLGPGLGMEVGDSFWFWSDHAGEQPGAYFQGLEASPSDFAPYIGVLGRAGYLDTLHSWGNFSRHGGFRREHAEVAARALADEGFSPSVWINHGGSHDFQNLWTGCGDVPENPEARGAPAPEYHLDLTWKLGFRYAWLGELTLVPGQDRKLGLADWFIPGSTVPRETVAHLGRAVARRLGYRQLLEKYPNYATFTNRLLSNRRLRDGRQVRTFVRYGDFARATFSDLTWLLRDAYLDSLEAGGGTSILFVHWCRHEGRSFENLDPEALRALAHLAVRAREKRIWVTTTGRLLAYTEARDAVRLEPGPGERWNLLASPLPDGRTLQAGDLAGLAFRSAGAGRPEIYFEGQALALEPVPGEARAWWVPVPPLRFPEPPRVSA
jgi:hypothetical protein